MAISYDSSSPFPYKFEFSSCNANEKRITSIGGSDELIIKNRGDGLTIINEYVCLLTSEQKEKLFSILGKWVYSPF